MKVTVVSRSGRVLVEALEMKNTVRVRISALAPRPRALGACAVAVSHLLATISSFTERVDACCALRVGIVVGAQDTVGDLKDRVKQSLKVGKERQRLTIDDPKGGKPVVLGQDDVQLRWARRPGITVACEGVLKRLGSARPASPSHRSIGSGRDMKVVFKDLGPQVAYRTVFIVEYLLPLSLYVLVFLARDKLFPAQGVP